MTLECLADVTVKYCGHVHTLQPGQTLSLPREKALRLLEQVPDRVRLLQGILSPLAPLQPGWLVTYRDQSGKLCGGSIDRQHGTVKECKWDADRWTVGLTDGQRVPIAAIRGVGKTDAQSRLVAAWTVREHGYDGSNGEAMTPEGDVSPRYF